MLFDDILEYIPHLGLQTLYHLLCALDVVSGSVLNKLLHIERLEQLDRHLLRKTALVDLQLRPNDDNGTSGIVNSLTQQVLTETSLLTFQHIGKGFQCTVSRTGDRSAAASVVDEGIDCLLQHTLLVTDDDIRSAKLKQAGKTVVTVDDSSV